MKEKRQTSAQRVTNPVWLREQIQQLIKDCGNNIKEDLELADQTHGDTSQGYRASVSSTRHWKSQLERILRGKTFTEELRESVKRSLP